MLTGNSFLVSFPDIVGGDFGKVLGGNTHTDNYYAKESSLRETMCCNCEKEGEPIG